MQRLALREVWWPLAVAVAWVLLRSQQVVQQLLDRHSRKPITFTTVAIYAAALKAGGQHTTPKFENRAAAFDELQHHSETGEIEIVGTPFTRVGDLEGSSRLEMGDQQTIPSSEMSSLVYYEDYGEPCLIPRDWHKAHGSSARTHLRGYRNVLVRSAALVGRFPPIDQTAPGTFVLTVPALDAFVETVPAPDATLFGDGAPVEERTQPVPSDAVVREKMGPEPTDAEVPAPSASAKWAAATTRNLRAGNRIAKDIKQAELARLLATASEQAVKAGQISRALKASYIENQLGPWGIWPLDRFK